MMNLIINPNQSNQSTGWHLSQLSWKLPLNDLNYGYCICLPLGGSDCFFFSLFPEEEQGPHCAGVNHVHRSLLFVLNASGLADGLSSHTYWARLGKAQRWRRRSTPAPLRNGRATVPVWWQRQHVFLLPNVLRWTYCDPSHILPLAPRPECW